jgi:hypothetical protein
MNTPQNRTNAPNTTHHLQPLGREAQNKQSTHVPSSPTMCHAERPPDLLHHGTIPSNGTYTIVDLYDPAKLQQSTPISVPGATTDPGHSAWGPCHIHRLTPLSRTQITKTAMRAPPPPNHHRGHHCTLHDSSSPLAPMGPQHLDSNMDQARITRHPPPPLAQWDSKHDASRKVTTLGSVVARPQGRGLHPESPRRREYGALPWCPQQGDRHPRALPSGPPSTGEDFRPTAPLLLPARGHGRSPPHHLCSTTTERDSAHPGAPPRRRNMHPPVP